MIETPTVWMKDAPPGGTTSILVGCFKAGVGRVGDISECISECNPPPDVIIGVTGTINVNVTIKGLN